MKLLVIWLALNSPQQAFSPLDSIQNQIAEKPDNHETILWICEVAFSYWATNPELSETLAKIALEKAQSHDFTDGKARAFHVWGISYWARDLYDVAIEKYFLALSHYESSENLAGIAHVNGSIGAVYDDLEQFEDAKKHELKALSMHRSLNDSIRLPRILNNLGILFNRMGKRDSALAFYRESLDIRKIQKDSLGIARLYNNLAVIHLQNNQTRIALLDLESAKEFLLRKPEGNLLSSVYANLGEAFTRIGFLQRAHSSLDSSIYYARSIGSLSKEQVAYEKLVALSLESQDKSKAFDYLVKQTALDQRIRNEKVSNQVRTIQARFENEKREHQLVLLEKERAEQENLIRIAWMALITAISYGGFFIYVVTSRSRRNRKLSKIRLEHLKEEVNVKNKEIASYTLNFIQKSELMEELKEQISLLRKGADVSAVKHLNKISRILDESFRSDHEWETFRITFEQMHDGFFSALRAAYPELGNSEIKLCALIRLNMNLKESARVLGISPQSVKTARYRLRKKLYLKTEDNLADFLTRFEQEVLS